ncbi:hypothetical protein JCM3765_007608 [Sporobolomyces pararoseus]
MSTSTPRLPDELITEVFRNQTLSLQDLSACCLLSKRFLSTGQRLLYEEISVRMGRIHDGEGADGRDRIGYSRTTWKLLKTLVDNKHLAQFIRKITFCQDQAEEEIIEGLLETTPDSAIANFLRFAPLVREIAFDAFWSRTRQSLDLISQFKSVEGLKFSKTSEEEVSYIAQVLPDLKFFNSDHIEFNPRGPRGVTTVLPARLEVLEIYEGDPDFKAALVSTNSSTLRKLQVGLEVALRLDYAKLSALSELTIDNTPRVLLDEPDIASRNSSEFFDSLSKSPSLRTLSFSPSAFYFQYEYCIFPGTYARPEDGLKKPIATLRTIRFEQDVSLDRCNSVLSGPFAENLHRLVVPSELVSLGADPLSKNKLTAIVGMCESRGIEVVLSDDW